MYKFDLFLFVIIVAILAMFMPVKVASANGVHAPPVEVYSGIVGQYQIRIESTQTVGDLHIAVRVMSVLTETPVTDATVKIVGSRMSDGVQIGPIIGIYDPASEAYLASVFVAEAGNWMFTIDLSSLAGNNVVEVPILLLTPPGANVITIAGVLALFALALWFTFRVLNQNFKKRKGG